MGLLISPPFAEPYYFHRVQLLGYKSPMPIALCRITLKMALDFQMTWVKKDNSLTVLRGNTWRFFNSVLEVVLVLCYWNRFNMYGLFSPLTGQSSTWHLQVFGKLALYSVRCQTHADSWVPLNPAGVRPHF